MRRDRVALERRRLQAPRLLEQGLTEAEVARRLQLEFLPDISQRKEYLYIQALALSQVVAERGAPVSITVDNGTEFLQSRDESMGLSVARSVIILRRSSHVSGQLPRRPVRRSIRTGGKRLRTAIYQSH
jgi:hypothetical protein